MALIDGFLVSSQERKADLEETHDAYQRNVRQWQIGLDAYDGTGGFLDGGYLWPFPREDGDQFTRRRAQARYHNYVETLVDIYVRHITAGVTRESDSEALTDWWNDVDGQGTPMTDYMGRVLAQALSAGHAGILVDKAAVDPEGPSQADDPNLPYVQTFTSLAIRDWREDRNGLAAVKLSEAAPATDLADSETPKPGYLLWDREFWARFDSNGEALGMDAHGLGVVPMAVMRPKPSSREPFIGKPLITPSLVQALYNRASEEDVVLRDQAFSLFVIQVPIDASETDVKAATDMLAPGVGTTTVAVVKGNADFRTADMQVPQTLREAQRELVHEIYRMSHLRFQRDSLQTESAEAMRLQRVDLDASLSAIAEQMATIEEQIAWLFFAWTTPNADQAMEAADVSIQYPSDFSIINVEEELAAVGTAIALNLGQTASRELKKRAVTIVLPDLSEETLELVRDEIENQAEGVGASSATLRDQAAERLRAAGVEVEEEAA